MAVIIKKYPNRRLYNTETSDYITLDDLYNMVKKGIDFIVQDTKTGADLTRVHLAQIIFDREQKGSNMLPLNFLKQLIGYYDDSLKAVLPEYLVSAMKIFAENQQKMKENMSDYMNDSSQNFSPFDLFEQMAKRNTELFETSLKVFFPNSNNKRS